MIKIIAYDSLKNWAVGAKVCSSDSPDETINTIAGFLIDELKEKGSYHEEVRLMMFDNGEYAGDLDP